MSINEQFKLLPFDSDDPVEMTKRTMDFRKLMIAINQAIHKQVGVDREKGWKILKMHGEKGHEKLGTEAMRHYKKLLEWLSQYDISEERVFKEFEAQKRWMDRKRYFQG